MMEAVDIHRKLRATGGELVLVNLAEDIGKEMNESHMDRLVSIDKNRQVLMDRLERSVTDSTPHPGVRGH